MDGLLAQEYGGYERNLPEAFQFAQGYNNVLQSALDTIERRKQQDLRRQFNEVMLDKAQQMSPLDIMRKKQEIDIDSAKQDPRYREGYIQNMQGTGMSGLAAGQTNQALQPLMQKFKTAEAKNALKREDWQSQLDQIDTALQTEPNPLTRVAYMKEKERIQNILKETPKFLGQRELRETGTDSAEYIAELRRLQALETARGKAGASGKPLNVEQAVVKDIYDRLAAGIIDNDQASREFAALFNRKTEGTPQSGVTAKVDEGGKIGLGNKPVKAPVTPKTGAKLSDDDLIKQYLK